MLKLKLQFFWPPDVKSWVIWKDHDAGKDRRQEEKGEIEDEMVGWHHRLNGHEFEQASWVGDEQGILGCKELDRTELLKWTELKYLMNFKGKAQKSQTILNNLPALYNIVE